MKIVKIHKKAVDELVASLSAEQRKKIMAGVQVLQNADPNAIAKLVDQQTHVAAYDSGPSGESGLSSW